jgi:hypothetical protein
MKPDYSKLPKAILEQIKDLTAQLAEAGKINDTIKIQQIYSEYTEIYHRTIEIRNISENICDGLKSLMVICNSFTTEPKLKTL